ncbi:MAG: hypothetical protein M1837_001276 [Sclerophora amabilis]|nr:MAG: hypothetical protein M1837_001276 [Sclerophora amabilis]
MSRSLDWTMEAFLERLRLWEAPLLRHQAYVTRLKSLEKEEKALQEAARIRVEGRMTTKIAQEIYTDLRRPFKQLETNQEGLLRCLSNFENAKMDPAADLKLQRIRASLIASYSDLATTGHLLRELLLRTVGMRHNRVAWHHLMEEIYYSLPWKEYAIALGEFNHTLDKSQKSIRTLRNGQRTYHRFTSIFFKERAESFGSAWEDWIREVRKRREGSISPHQRALNEYFIPFSRYLQKSSSTLRTTELLIREWDSNCLSLDRGQFKEKVLRLKKFMVKAHRSLIPLVSELTEVVALKMEIQAELSRLSSPKAQDDSAQHPPSCQQQSVQGESGESSNDLTSPVEDSESSSLISEDLFFNSSYDPILEGGAAPQEDLRSKHEIPSPSDGPKTPQIYHRPLSYHMPEEIKRQALLASASSGAAYWRFDLYRSPEGKKPMLHWCKSKEASERVAKLFLNETLVGFDIEWKPQASANDGIKRNVSVIQVASQERIALFHIAYFKEDTAADLVPPTLKHIMESAEITKAGVAIRADCTRLRKYLGIESRGIFELSHLYKLVKYSSSGSKNINKRLVSLAVQVEEHLQLPLWKGDTVRSSDWTKHLSMSQIEYAASDSYAAIHLFDVLEAKRKALKPVPPCPAHAELNLPIRLADGVSLSTADEVEECVEQLEVGDNEVEDTKI